MAQTATEERPWTDPIVAEVRRVREALFAAAGYDIHEYCRRLRAEQARSEQRAVGPVGAGDDGPAPPT